MVEEVFLIDKNEELDLKKAIANILYEKKLDQSKIANILNLSQPMVSNYLKSDNNFSKQIISLANQISEKIIENNNSCYFSSCVLFNKDIKKINYYLAEEKEIIKDENKRIIDTLYNAYQELKKLDLSKLLPKVKINLAMAKSNAKKPEDIASFVNGFVIVDNKIITHNGIRFGSSKHLSNLLLYLKKNFCINSIMNIKYLNFLNNKKFDVAFLTKDFKIKDKEKKFDILLHKGDFGIEPCTYVVGKDAREVAETIQRITKEV